MDTIEADQIGTEAPCIVTDYEGLLSRLIARRKALGLSQLAVDEIAGLQTGYCGKIEARMKGMGAMSFPCILQALGIELRVVGVRRHGIELEVIEVTPYHIKQNRVSVSHAA